MSANRNNCDSLQIEITRDGALFLLPSVSFLERKPKIKQIPKKVSSEKRGRGSLANTEFSLSGRYRECEGWEVCDEIWGIIHTQTPQRP